MPDNNYGLMSSEDQYLSARYPKQWDRYQAKLGAQEQKAALDLAKSDHQAELANKLSMKLELYKKQLSQKYPKMLQFAKDSGTGTYVGLDSAGGATPVLKLSPETMAIEAKKRQLAAQKEQSVIGKNKAATSLYNARAAHVGDMKPRLGDMKPRPTSNTTLLADTQKTASILMKQEHPDWFKTDTLGRDVFDDTKSNLIQQAAPAYLDKAASVVDASGAFSVGQDGQAIRASDLLKAMHRPADPTKSAKDNLNVIKQQWQQQGLPPSSGPIFPSFDGGY